MRSLLIIATCFFYLFSTQPSHAELIDRIVAIVDEDIITLSELNEEGHTYFQAVMQNVPTQYLEQELQKARQEVLNQLIERLLIQHQADTFGFTVTEEDIDRTIDSILMENNLTVADFKRDLQKRGTSENVYRNKIRSQMLRSRLVNFLIRSKVVISEEKIADYYNTYYSTKTLKPGFHIAQIGFLWGEKFKAKTQEEARQNAEFVRKKLLAGEDFAELAINYSDLPSAEDGGDIGVFQENELAPYMRDSLQTLKPGESSPIVQTPIGYQILKLLSAHSAGSPSTLADAREEIKSLLFKQEMETGYESWITSIRAKSYIKENL